MDKREAERKLRQLLREPEGRAVLGIVEEEVKPVRRPRVALLVPSYKQVHPLMQESVGEMMRYSRQYVDIYSPPRMSGSVIHWSRNTMLAQLELSGEHYDYVLFCDDDMVVKPDFLMRLLESGKQIIGGVCTKRQDPPMPNIRHLDKNFRYGVIVKWDRSVRVMEVDAVGTGFLLISRGAVQAVGEYFLRCGYERQTFGRMFDKTGADDAGVAAMEDEFAIMEAGRRDQFRRTGDGWWFQFLPSLVQEGELGEDISFCLKAKLIGIPIFVETTVTPGHVGDYVYSVDDFFEHQGEALERASA